MEQMENNGNTLTVGFGSMVFGDAEMKNYLGEEVYQKLRRTQKNGRGLAPDIADAVADGMRKWAVSRGATHYTHWFQPMTGVTAEKHDSFICYDKEGRAIDGFSGKELIKGESDASSFPSGGLRATFEARGYTAWDPTSYAFVKGRTLYIPTAFYSYSGHVLDKKTPLLRSMERLNKAALRILALFGNNEVLHVNPTVGPEQEYFLVPEELFELRHDLKYTGRTLFGAKPPKGQELDDHYYGAIDPRVSAFMSEVNEELWKLGVPAKTEHNEVAPAQFELAPIFATANIAADQNQITMEVLRTVARKHGFVCLLHEKPFDGLNGSGKHNNWSLSTDRGTNLLEPGDTPYENAQFLLFVTALISAVDRYPELIRVSVATAGNDCRLGGSEAPPTIISIFLGDELTEILESVKNGTPYGGREKELLRVGVHVLPKFPRDTTDRNRTSPIAFTGNKFEFRIPGSSASISDINTVINSIMSETLNGYADALEGSDDFEKSLHELIRSELSAHERIIFNGNGYGEEWREEAALRGLPEIGSTPEACDTYLSDKNVALMTTLGILTEEEMRARYEIMLESYVKLTYIEALTMTDMARREILPAVASYRRTLTGETMFENDLSRRLKVLTDNAYFKMRELEKAVADAKSETETRDASFICLKRILPTMKLLRGYCDAAESLTSEEFWPFPSYGDLLFALN